MHDNYHPYTWVLWLATGTGMALLIKNPLYLLILILATAFVFRVMVRRSEQGSQAAAATSRPQTWKPILNLALFLMLFTIAFNALTVHYGDHILLILPSYLPIIGGIITLEAVMYGVTAGLGFLALILLFATFNSVVGPQTLLRMTPSFAHHAAVSLTIAISFIPQTIIAWYEIRDAQRLRGYKVRGIRDLRPMFVSLLGNGLDRAIQLAESMDARGFGGSSKELPGRKRYLSGGGAICGLILLLAGLFVRSYGLGPAAAGIAMLVLGGILVVISLRLQSQRHHRSYYRHWIWRRRDTYVAVTLIFCFAAVFVLDLIQPQVFFYYPYPPFPLLPDFNPAIGLLLIFMLAPALFIPAAPTRAISNRKASSQLPGISDA